jgi:four helix bundle protein
LGYKIGKINKFDLEERTYQFGLACVKFSRTLKPTYFERPIITQFVKSGTSLGANYCEANDAESKNDFIHKIGICKKESKETKYWVRMLGDIYPDNEPNVEPLASEINELILIFSAIIRTSNK